MTAFTLGEATALALGRVRLDEGAAMRLVAAGAAVRRGSVEAGSFEAAFFAVPAKGETDRLLRTARAALDAGRRLKRDARAQGRGLSASERALTALTAGAVRVYEEICTLARLNAGRVFPSYDHLARATALGRATVARALVVLEAAGFLVRQRRFRRIDGDGAGPRRAQTSNAYRATLPARLMGLLPRWLRPAPPPEDATWLTSERTSELAIMRSTLSCRDLAHTIADGALGHMLARLGASIDRRRRESHCEPETHLTSDYLSGSAC